MVEKKECEICKTDRLRMGLLRNRTSASHPPLTKVDTMISRQQPSPQRPAKRLVVSTGPTCGYCVLSTKRRLATLQSSPQYYRRARASSRRQQFRWVSRPTLSSYHISGGHLISSTTPALTCEDITSLCCVSWLLVCSHRSGLV